ncbi:MAG: iron ABC transporter substrate-binding protein [Thermomicrobium sp.]|nr:iron ABC transporter substrate-binding protein [Thermomicrobium sp.]
MRRRDLLRLGGFGLAAGATLLTACGGSGTPTPTPASATTPVATSPTPPGAAATPTAAPAATATVVSGTPTAGTGTTGGTLTIYSGRSKSLIGPLLDRIGQELGLDVRVRYGDTAELATAILEEGPRSPADLFFGQDAGALGALAKEGRLIELPTELLDRVPERYRSKQGLWVGISGRVRTVVYNTERVRSDEIPTSIVDFAGNERWRERLGWAPTNGSFQAFVTALRRMRGDEAARRWLEGIKGLGTRPFPNNASIVQATIKGEIEAGFVNHYYLMRERAQAGRPLPAENHFYTNGDPGGLVNVAGIGILASSRARDLALRFADYLLSEPAQRYFSEQTFEYPLLDSVAAHPDLPPLASLNPPALDLSELDDLRGTLAMLQEVGLL